MPEKANSPPLLYSRKRAADALSLSVRAIDQLIADGRLQTRRIGYRVLIPASVIAAFAAQDQPQPIISSAKRTNTSATERRKSAA